MKNNTSKTNPSTHHQLTNSPTHQQTNNTSKPIINELSVYTTEETQTLLSISRSTFMRLIKKEILRANKIGGQYRVLGREILRLLLPKEEFDKIKGFVRNSGNVGHSHSQSDNGTKEISNG